MKNEEVIEKLQNANIELFNLFYQTNDENIRKEIAGIILDINQRLDKISKINEVELDPVLLRDHLQKRANYIERCLGSLSGLIDGHFMPEIGYFDEFELVDMTPVIEGHKKDLEETKKRIAEINQMLGEDELKR